MGVSLPQRYLDIVAEYPQPLLDLADVYPARRKQPEQRVGPETGDLYNAPHLLRLANLSDVEYRPSIFPPHFFIIGDSGCGDYYAIDTSADSAPVYESGPHAHERNETGAPSRLTESIEDWVDVIISTN